MPLQVSDLPKSIAKLWQEWGGLLGPDAVIPNHDTVGFVDDARGSHFPQVHQLLQDVIVDSGVVMM